MKKNVNNNYEIHSNGDMYMIDGNIKLKASTKAGIPVYYYSHNGKLKTSSIKKLVAIAFIPNPMSFNFVKNIDGDVNNNDISNLSWCENLNASKIINEEGKECTECKKFLPHDKFPKRNNRNNGRQSKCVKCVTKSNKIRKLKYPDTGRDSHYKRYYNITLDEYNEILKSQNKSCAICGINESDISTGRKTKLCVDHCHSTGRIRGILCDKCNRGIGLLQDDPKIISNALSYLNKEH